MTSRDDHARCQLTIDRLARELAQVRKELAEAEADNGELIQQLAEAEARARTWRRVAQWIHEAHSGG